MSPLHSYKRRIDSPSPQQIPHSAIASAYRHKTDKILQTGHTNNSAISTRCITSNPRTCLSSLALSGAIFGIRTFHPCRTSPCPVPLLTLLSHSLRSCPQPPVTSIAVQRSFAPYAYSFSSERVYGDDPCTFFSRHVHRTNGYYPCLVYYVDDIIVYSFLNGFSSCSIRVLQRVDNAYSPAQRLIHQSRPR